MPVQVGCRESSRWPLPLWVAPELLSWMSLQPVWTLLPVATFGSCCSNTGKVRVGGRPEFSWILLEGSKEGFWQEALGMGF